MPESLFNKVAVLQSVTLLEKRPWLMFFCVFCKIFKSTWQQNEQLNLCYSGLAVSKMPQVRQPHAIKHVLYYGVR